MVLLDGMENSLRMSITNEREGKDYKYRMRMLKERTGKINGYR